MIIKEVNFLISSSKFHQLPKPDHPEFAFIGRSNVGKSSLINKLCGRKKLAKVSSTPGKTQTINHFTVNENWYLVDLPGYGYAKVSKKQRGLFSRMIQDYLLRRENLMNVFLLIDSRHPPQKSDLEFIEFLGMSGIPFSIVFTKIDKLGKHKVVEYQKAYEVELHKTWEELPPLFSTSSETGIGMEAILKYIGDIIENTAEK